MSNAVLLQRSDHLAVVALNRPDRLNAIHLAMWRQLHAVMREVAADGSIRCVVVRGAGGAFAAGADIAEFLSERATPAQAEAYAAVMQPALAALRDCPQPTVAAIRGACVGAGLEIAMMCDLRIAARSARFGVPIQRLGMTMPHFELAALVELVGRPTALEILFEGGIFDASEAATKRLVNRVVDDPQLDAEVLSTVRRIAEGAPLSHRWHKQFARRCLDPRPITAEETAEGFASAGTADYREGVAAFLDKRKPTFQGR